MSSLIPHVHMSSLISNTKGNMNLLRFRISDLEIPDLENV